jgi:hypothetical protein
MADKKIYWRAGRNPGYVNHRQYVDFVALSTQYRPVRHGDCVAGNTVAAYMKRKFCPTLRFVVTFISDRMVAAKSKHKNVTPIESGVAVNSISGEAELNSDGNKSMEGPVYAKFLTESIFVFIKYFESEILGMQIFTKTGP